MTKTHVLPTTPDTTLGTVWRCVNCLMQTTPFSDDECDGPTLHAHVSTASSDCDGPFYREYITELNDDERGQWRDAQGVNDFHDLHFKERVLGNHVSFHSEGGVTVKVDENGFHMHEQTDEGYRSAEVRWCEDEDCDPNAASQRDVYAEMMGY